MDAVLFAGITVRQVVIGIAVLAAIGSVLGFLNKKKVGAPKEHLVEKRCNACRWKGSVSKFNTKCPKCSKPIG